MLEITIPASEIFNEETSEFIQIKEQKLRLEHSLVSLSKWESKWCKPFLTKESKTYEESTDYIRCMTITQNVDPKVYNNIPIDIISKVNAYIDAPMTATTINDRNQKKNREIVTAEIIYYWMIEFGIPFECQKWHLNRLITLITVCNIKQSPQKKMAANKKLNDARRKKYNTRG